jgi:hypothetical protein
MERTRLNDRARRAPRGEGGSDQRKQQPRRDQSQPAPSAKVQPPPLMPPLPHSEPHAEHAHRLLAHRTYDERCSVDRACADAVALVAPWNEAHVRAWRPSHHCMVQGACTFDGDLLFLRRLLAHRLPLQRCLL